MVQHTKQNQVIRPHFMEESVVLTPFKLKTTFQPYIISC